MSAALIRGWCPTPLRPMESGDGLLARIVPPIAGFDAPALEAIAALAASHGIGAIEITQRRNLQLRGFTPDSFADYLAEAIANGLVSADERIATVVAPGIAFDPTIRADAAVIAENIAPLLKGHSPEMFPTKFVIVVGSGGNAGLDDVTADIRIDPAADHWRIGLCGTLDGASAVAMVSARDIPAALEQLLSRYPDRDGQRGKGAMFAAQWARAAGLANASPRPVGRISSITAARGAWLRPAFGRLGASRLAALAKACREAGCKLLPGPGRSLLISGGTEAARQAVVASATEPDFVTRADDARQFVDVCTGAPGCRNASTPTIQDAARLAAGLADELGPDRRLHVSGCIKGCARPERSAFTLTAANGRYHFATDATAAEAVSGAALADLRSIKALLTESAHA